MILNQELVGRRKCSIHLMMQGVQILRVHDVNDITRNKDL